MEQELESVTSEKVPLTIEQSIFLWKNFRHLTELEIQKYSDSTTACVEIREDKELIAVGLMEDNHLSLSAVSEGFRGNNLQITLIKNRIKIAKEKGYDNVTSYVRCNNLPSLKNLLKCNFKIMSTIRYDNDDEGYLLEWKTN